MGVLKSLSSTANANAVGILQEDLQNDTWVGVVLIGVFEVKHPYDERRRDSSGGPSE